MTEEIEIWKPIPSYPGVEASSFGRIKITPHQEPYSRGGGMRTYGGFATYGSWDYTTQRFCFVRRRYKTRNVAKLICEAFHGQKPFPKAVCIHKDEDSQNNKPTNLKWGTQKENLNAPGFIAYCKSRTGNKNPNTVGKIRAAQTLKHHAEDLIGVGTRAIKKLRRRGAK